MATKAMPKANDIIAIIMTTYSGIPSKWHSSSFLNAFSTATAHTLAHFESENSYYSNINDIEQKINHQKLFTFPQNLKNSKHVKISKLPIKFHIKMKVYHMQHW